MLAKREHQANLIPILEKALDKSNLLIFNNQLSISNKFSNSNFQKLQKILERARIAGTIFKIYSDD